MDKSILRAREKRAEKLEGRLNVNGRGAAIASVIVVVSMTWFVFFAEVLTLKFLIKLQFLYRMRREPRQPVARTARIKLDQKIAF